MNTTNRVIGVVLARHYASHSLVLKDLNLKWNFLSGGYCMKVNETHFASQCADNRVEANSGELPCL
jgi:hypothetical protein